MTEEYHEENVSEKLIILTHEVEEIQETLVILKEKVNTLISKSNNNRLLLKEIKTMASQGFELMEAKMAELKTVDDSVLALVTDLSTRIANATTLEEAQQIVAEIDAEKTRLLNAVNANVPPVTPTT